MILRLLFGGISIENLLNGVLGSHDDRDTLVDVFRGDLHDTFLSGRGKTSGLLHDEGHRGSLVQQSKLSVGVFRVSGVSENSSVQQSTVDISDHGSNVSAGETLSTLAGSRAPSRDNVLEWLVPFVEVGFVHGVDIAFLGDLDIGLRKDEFSNGLVKGEAVNTVSESQGKEGRGGVQAVGGSNKVGSWLKGVGEAIGFLFRALVTDATGVDIAVLAVFVNSNDGSGGDSGINIGRTIERVEHGNVFLSLFDNNFLGVTASISDQVDLQNENDTTDEK